MRVLLDSSVLVSAFLIPENPAGVLIKAGLGGRFEMRVSLQILEEADRASAS